MAAAALLAAAIALGGHVVAVHDGDTITVLHDHQQVKVRLVEIDAPELGQPFGKRSKQSLSDLCYNKPASIETRGQDKYGRTLARTTCDGQDANAEQVRRGMAWVYNRYAKPDSPLYHLQEEAKSSRRGLWADPSPIPPWEWRAKKKTTSK